MEEKKQENNNEQSEVLGISIQGQSHQPKHVIAGGAAAGGTTKLGRKRHACTVQVMDIPSIKLKCFDPIIFANEDMDRVDLLQSDVMSVIANVGGIEIRSLLVDNRTFYDILFLETFLKIGIKLSNLNLAQRALQGLQDQAPIAEIISLPLTFGKMVKNNY